MNKLVFNFTAKIYFTGQITDFVFCYKKICSLFLLGISETAVK